MCNKDKRFFDCVYCGTEIIITLTFLPSLILNYRMGETNVWDNRRTKIKRKANGQYIFFRMIFKYRDN
jgi:hypothetical protein